MENTNQTCTRDFTLTLFKRRTFCFLLQKIRRVQVVRIQVLLHTHGGGSVQGGRMSDTRWPIYWLARLATCRSVINNGGPDWSVWGIRVVSPEEE